MEELSGPVSATVRVAAGCITVIPFDITHSVAGEQGNRMEAFEVFNELPPNLWIIRLENDAMRAILLANKPEMGGPAATVSPGNRGEAGVQQDTVFHHLFRSGLCTGVKERSRIVNLGGRFSWFLEPRQRVTAVSSFCKEPIT